MAKYKKKPVVIEAFRFQIDDVMPDWFNEKRITNEIITHEDGTCDINYEKVWPLSPLLE